MKRFYLFGLLTILLSGLFFACSDDDDDPIVAPVELRLNKATLNFTSAAGRDSITVTSNYKWTYELAKTEDAVWCQLSANDTLLYVTLLPNESQESRSTKITVTASYKEKSEIQEITVTQKGFIPGEAPTIFVDPEEIMLPSAAGASYTVEITTDPEDALASVAWSWVNEQGEPAEKPDWLEEPVQEEIHLTVKTASENTEKTSRKAWLKLTCGQPDNQGEMVLAIIQEGLAGEPYLRIVGNTFQNDTLTLPQNGEEVFITVETNLPWGEYPYDFSPKGKPTIYTRYWDDLKKFGITWREVPQPAVQGNELVLKTNNKTFGFKSEPNNGPTKYDSGYSLDFFAHKGDKDTEYTNLPDEWLDANKSFFYHFPITFCIEGLPEAKLEVSSEFLTFTRNASKQIVTIKSDMEWRHEIVNAEMNSWIQTEQEEGQLTVSVEENPNGWMREGEIKIISGGSTKTITVSQSEEAELKSYQLGELYYQDGEPVGIVYKLFDTDAEGKGRHGLVFALKEYDKDRYGIGLAFSKELYPGSTEEEEVEKYPSKSVAFDENDGRKNMDALRDAYFPAGKSFIQNYPAAAYVHQLNTNMAEDDMYTGQLNLWYLPSINELGDLLVYLDCSDARWTYEYSDEYPNRPSMSQQAHERYLKTNELIKAHNGIPICYDEEEIRDYYKHYVSSTEVRDMMIPTIYSIRFDYGYKDQMACENHGQGYDALVGTFSVRPILRF